MTFTLSGACVFAFEAPFKKRILSLVRILLHFSYTVLLLYLFGYFTETKIGITDTFGRFSSDLLAFFNTGGYSYFFPKIRQGGGQYEGNAYLGLGGMLLFIHSLYIIKKTKIFKKNSLTLMYPILLSLTVLWIYALSKHISFAGHTFLKLDTFYQMIEPIPSILRSSGRMIWPVFYFIFIFIIWIHSKYLFKKTSAAFLLIIFVIQVSEFRPYFFPWKIKLEPQTKMLLDNSAWKGTLASKKNLILIPPTLSGQTCSCTSSNLFTTNEMLIFAHLTSTFGLSLNSGFLGRPFKNRTEYCDSFCRHFATNEIDKDDVYVFRNTMDLSRIDAFQKNTLCLDLDGYTVCSKR